MLTPPDADLVRRDPALPGLTTLLDPDAFAAALRRSLPGADLGAAHITYVKYKPGTNCLAGYRLVVNEAAVDVYGKAYPSDARNKLRKARDQAGVPGPLGPGRLVLEDCAVVVSVFPNDSKVTTLTCVADAKARQRLFHELVPDRPDLWEGTVERLVYKPERRYVAQLLTHDGARAALKVYTRSGYDMARTSAKAFEPRGPLRLAPQLGGSDRHSVLAFEWLSGRPLSQAIADPELDFNAVATVGAALAELHAQTGEGLSCLTREAEGSNLVSEAVGLGIVCPHLAGRADDLARRLAAHLMYEPPVARPVHGDFHARQVLLSDGAAAILDVDRSVRADPMMDLGLFIAHLEREVVRGNLLPGRVEPLREALLDGYRAATRRPLPARVELYTAVGLFGLAPRSFRYCEPNWSERAEAILEQAEAILKTIPTGTFSPPLLRSTKEGWSVEHPND